MVRSIVLILVIGVTAAVGPSPAADTTGRSWIRLDTGREILAVGEVERDGGVVLYRTVTGVLLSIPESSVVAVEAVVIPDPSREAVPVDPPAQIDADVPLFTNDDLPTVPLPWQATFERAPGSTVDALEEETDVEVPALSYDTYRDRNGNDEAWWRERAAAIDAERDEARGEYEIWSQRYRSLSDLVAIECVGRRFAHYLPAVCAEYVRLQRDANERAADARAWLDEVDAERRSLSDEARRADALPGWLR